MEVVVEPVLVTVEAQGTPVSIEPLVSPVTVEAGQTQQTIEAQSVYRPVVEVLGSGWFDWNGLSGLVTLQGELITSINARLPLGSGVLAEASAVSELGVRITATENSIDILANDVTTLNTSLSGKAEQSAVDSLTSQVTLLGDDIVALGTRTTAIESRLPAGVDPLVSASALNSLSALVSSIDGTLTSNVQSVLDLQAAVAGKAEASALDTVQAQVVVQGDAITSHGERITDLEAVVPVGGGMLATAAALNALEARVEVNEDTIALHSTAITDLEASIAAVGGTNLLANPSFDSDQVAGGFPADYWEEVALAGSSTAWSQVGSILPGSVYALRLDRPGATTNEYAGPRSTSDARPLVTAGNTYTLSAYVRGGNSSALCYIQWLNDANTIIGTSVYNGGSAMPLDGTFQRIILTAVAPANAVKANLLPARFIAVADGAQWGEVDNAQFEEASVPSNWSDNPGAVLGLAVSLLDTRVVATESGIVSLSSDVTALESEIAGKADASALDSLDTRVTSAEDEITSQGTRITSLENTVNDPTTGVAATAAAVSSLDSRVDVTEASITSQASSITTLNAQIGAIGGTGSNLQDDRFVTFPVLPPDSGLTQATPVSVDTSDKIIEGSLVLPFPSGDVRHYFGPLDGSMYLTAGTYIISMWVKCSVANSWLSRLRLGVSPFTNYPTAVVAIAANTWTRVHGVATVAVDGMYALSIDPQVESGAHTWRVDGVMVEAKIGPSSEPSEFQRGVAAQKATSTASAVTALDARVTSAEGTLTSQASSITSLQSSLNSIGGDNLLHNSGYEIPHPSANRGYGWSAVSNPPGAAGSLVASSLPGSAVALRIEHSALGNSQYLESYLIVEGPYVRPKVQAGKPYTYSVYARGSTNGAFKSYVQWRDSGGSVINTMTLPDSALSETEWQRFTITTPGAPAGAVDVQVCIGRLINKTGSTQSMWLELDNAMLQEGSVATAYTPGSKDNAQAVATSDALSSLDSRVTSAEGTITSQASSITSLNASIDAIGGNGVNLLDAERSYFRSTTGNPTVAVSSWAVSYVADSAARGGVAQRCTAASTILGYVFQSNTINSYTANGGMNPMQPGKYLVSITAKANVAGVLLHPRLRNQAGTYATGYSYISLTTTYTRYTQVLTLPAGTTSANFSAWLTALAAGNTVDISDMMVELQLGDSTTASPWREGRNANLLEGTASAVSALDARVTTTEAGITQYKASYKVALNANGVATGFTSETNGTTSTFKIQADKFEITPSSASGARTEFSSGHWKIYDSSGVLRVRLGVWP